MVEKKFVVEGMKLEHRGTFDIIEFYKVVEDWIRKKGKEKEIKKKLEHVGKGGKGIEWFVEIWEQVADWAKTIVRLDALFKNVREVKVKAGKSYKIMHRGEVLIILDGILETDIAARWQQKPIYYFLRTLVDKFIYKLWTHRYDDKIASDVEELHKVLTDFFRSYE